VNISYCCHLDYFIIQVNIFCFSTQNPLGNCKDTFLKTFCKVVGFIKFIGSLSSMTYCIAVNNSSVCWIIYINAYSSCLIVTSNSLWLNKVTFNHKMSLVISWKWLWDWIMSFLTMLDRLVIAMFTVVTVSSWHMLSGLTGNGQCQKYWTVVH
jgi:hypothetical protein